MVAVAAQSWEAYGVTVFTSQTRGMDISDSRDEDDIE